MVRAVEVIFVLLVATGLVTAEDLGVSAAVDVVAGEAPLKVRFGGAAVGGKPTYAFDWDFGDGGAASDQNPTHSYQNVGAYEAVLTISDSGGASAVGSISITVLKPGSVVFSPIATFGNALHYQPKNASRWEVKEDEGDRRYFLNTTDYSNEGDRLGEYALIKGRAFGDFKMQFEAKSGDDLVANPDADYCVVFGFQDRDNYYYAMYHRNDSALFKVIGGVRTQLGTDYPRAVAVFDQYHRISVERAGTEITVAFDGKAEIVADDAEFGEGALGVGSYNDSAFFDEIEVFVDCPTGRWDCNGIRSDGCEVQGAADPENCGDCENRCGAGLVCNDGACQGRCPPDRADCGGVCVDLRSSPQHCGACSLPCAAGDFCSDGECRPNCGPGTRPEDGSCIAAAANGCGCVTGTSSEWWPAALAWVLLCRVNIQGRRYGRKRSSGCEFGYRLRRN